jgi:hypothetical protein
MALYSLIASDDVVFSDTTSLLREMEPGITDAISFDDETTYPANKVRITEHSKILAYVPDGNVSARVTESSIHTLFKNNTNTKARVTVISNHIVFLDSGDQKARVTATMLVVMYTPIKVRETVEFDDQLSSTLITAPIELTEDVEFEDMFNKKGITDDGVTFDDTVVVIGGKPDVLDEDVTFDDELTVVHIIFPVKDRVKFNDIVDSVHPQINVYIDEIVTFDDDIFEPGYATPFDGVQFDDAAEIWQSGSDDDNDSSQVEFDDIVEAELVFWDHGSQIRIYSDSLTQYPDHYWAGDRVSIVFDRTSLDQTWQDQYAHVHPDRDGIPDAYAYDDLLIVDSGSEENAGGWIELAEALPHYIFPNTTMSLRKDNIVEESFQWTKRAKSETPNQVKVEYLDRDEDYKINIMDISDDSDQDYQDGILREVKYQIHPFKKQSVAHRMAMILLNENNLASWRISFETDIVGFKFCMGDIIGITREDMNWEAKLFRILQLEEMEDHHTKVTAMEYLPQVYDASYGAVTRRKFSRPAREQNPYLPPNQLRQVTIYEDVARPRLYVLARPSDYDPELTFGASLAYAMSEKLQYYPDLHMWANAGGLIQITPSIKVTYDNFTTLTFDPSAIVGTMPDRGTIVLFSELIKYNHIDRTNGVLSGLIRGYKDSRKYYYAPDLTVAAYGYLFDENVNWYYTYEEEDIGNIFWIKSQAVSKQGVINRTKSPMQAWIEIGGMALKPLSVMRSLKTTITFGAELV